MKPVRSVSHLRHCDRHKFAPGEVLGGQACGGAETPNSPPPVSTWQESTAPAREGKRGFYHFGGAGDRGLPLTARRRLFMDAPTSALADCMLSGSDYLPMETCFYILPAPISREDRQRLTDGVDPVR